MSLFATKPISAVAASGREGEPTDSVPLRRVLGAVDLTMLGIGAIIGTQQLGVPAPMAVAVDAARIKAVGTSWQPVLDLMPFVVKLGAIMGLSSTIIVQMMAQPRVFLAMSRDGLLPEWASRIHPRFRTPHLTTLLTGAIVIVASGFTPIGVLGALVSIGTLFAFVIVSIGVIVLRRTRPDLERPFRVPFVPALPIASAVVVSVDARAAVVDVGAVDRVDADRTGDLFCVWEDALKIARRQQPLGTLRTRTHRTRPGFYVHSFF